METSIIIDRPELHPDARKAAEAFIDKVIATRRQPLKRDEHTVRARSEQLREDRNLALGELTASGIEHKRLDALAKERTEARQKLTEQAHRRAIEASAAAADRLRGLLPVFPPPVDVTIDTVTFIRSFAGQGTVIESNNEPGDNWARYKFDASGDSVEESGTGRLSFFTLWQNPKNTGQIVHASASLIVNAHLSTGADWGGVASWFFPDSEARATVRARTTVWRMDSSISSIVADVNLGSAAAHGGFFGDDQDSSIEFSDVLTASGVQVPKNEFVLIEVELLTEWVALDGDVHLDAQSGSFKVSLPQLTLTLSDL
jgi:hypothetical protein